MSNVQAISLLVGNGWSARCSSPAGVYLGGVRARSVVARARIGGQPRLGDGPGQLVVSW